MKKQILLLGWGLLFCTLLMLPVSAKEDSALPGIPEEFYTMLWELPDEVRDLLPDSLFAENTEEVGNGVSEMVTPNFLLSAVGKAFGAELGGCLRLFGAVAAILILSALLRTVASGLSSPGISRAFSLASTLTLFGVLLAMGYGMITRITAHFTTLGNLCALFLPLICTLYALGGNAGAAAASMTGLSVYMTLLEELVGKTILPFSALCLVLSLMGSMDNHLRTGSLLSTIKKNYTTLLGFLMMLLLALLSTQTVLGLSRDTLAMRSIKFAAGSLLPVVGGSVAELLRSVTAGVGYLRGTLGVSAILILILTLLPPIVELLLFRVTWQLSASLADLLGCDGEKRLLDEFASLCTYLLTALCICSSVLLLSLTLVSKCASALGV